LRTSPAGIIPLTLLCMEMISVFDSAVVMTIGFGRTSDAAPHAFHRIVSLGLMAFGGTATISVPTAFMCITLNGPDELLAENSHVPAVVCVTVVVWLFLFVYV